MNRDTKIALRHRVSNDLMQAKAACEQAIIGLDPSETWSSSDEIITNLVKEASSKLRILQASFDAVRTALREEAREH